MVGTSGTNRALTSTRSALAARAVGPPQGVRLVFPAASMMTQAAISGFIPSRR
jgi:hypothetical protein